MQALSYGDLAGGMTGPSIDVAWTQWNDRGHGLAAEVSTVFETQSEVGDPPRRPHLYWSVTWRRRWMSPDGRGNVHFGAGAAALLWQRRPNDQVGDGVLAHRAAGHAYPARWVGPARGISMTPWLFFPLSMQPTARVMWKF